MEVTAYVDAITVVGYVNAAMAAAPIGRSTALRERYRPVAKTRIATIAS